METVERGYDTSEGDKLLKNAAKALAKYIAVAGCSFFCSGANILGLAPFGITFCASIGTQLVPAAIMGSVAGYFYIYGLTIMTLRYISAAAVAGIISYVLRRGFKRRLSAIFAGFSSFFSIFITGIIISFSITLSVNEVILYFVEGAMGGFCGYFINSFFTVDARKRRLSLLSGRETAGMLMICSLIILSLTNIKLSFLNIAVVAASYVVCVAATYGLDRYAALFGICCGAACAGVGSDFISVAIALGGLFAGIFSRGNIIITALIFAASIGSASLLSTGENTSLIFIASALLGSLLLIITPPKIKRQYKKLFSFSYTGQVSDEQSILAMKIKIARSAINEIASNVKAIGGIYRRRNVPGEGSIYENVYNSMCKKCDKRDSCKNLAFTEKKINFPALITNEGKSDRVRVFSDLAKDCEFSMELGAMLESETLKYKSCISECAKTGETVNIVADGFDSLAKFLADISEDISVNEEYSRDKTSILKSVIKHDFGISPEGCGVFKTQEGRFVFEIILGEKNGKAVMEAADKIKERLQLLTSVLLNDAVFYRFSADSLCVRFCEKTKYDILFGKKQKSSKNGDWCGDTADSFYDGKGNFYMLLSDGMGTGKSAAADSVLCSSLTSTLLRAGFSLDSVLNPVNSAMIVRTGEESIASLDIAKINLYTGEVAIYKAGAGPSAAMQKGRLLKIDKPSLPIGILREIEFEEITFSLSHGDSVILMSDGVDVEKLPSWRDFLENALSFDEGELAEKLLRAAVFGSEEESDDITVVSATIVARE